MPGGLERRRYSFPQTHPYVVDFTALLLGRRIGYNLRTIKRKSAWHLCHNPQEGQQ